MRKYLLCLALISGAMCAQQATEQQKAQIIELKRIVVTGTRLPSLSVIALMNLKAGDKVNDALINTACHRLQSTGLVKSIDYQYLLYPDQPGATLTLTVVDEDKLVPATIEPKEDSDALWTALTKVSPLFTETLPPNERAIAFYEHNFDKCLHAMGRTEEYVGAKLVGDPGQDPTAVVFAVKKYKK